VGEHTSRGIFPYSKISRPEDLEPVVAKLCAAWPGQDILLETFLGGREFTVALLGEGEQAKVLGVFEMKWGQKSTQQILHSCEAADQSVDFATEAAKDSADWDGLDVVEASADPTDPVVIRAEEVALSAWRVLQCRDVGRVDLRFDKVGEGAIPYVLEVCTPKLAFWRFLRFILTI
jgi:D-alanine-D-alanine ligase